MVGSPTASGETMGGGWVFEGSAASPRRTG